MTFTPNTESINKPSYEILEDLSKINSAQLQTLIDKLKTESALLTERLCVKDFQKLIEKNLLTAIVDVDQNIIATAMLWEVENQPVEWYEVGTVWVSPEYRGQNLGHIVFRSITDKIPWNSNAFLLTSTLQIIHSAKTCGYGYVEKDFFEQSEFAIIPPAEPEHLLFAYYQTEFSISDIIKNTRAKYYD
jgi:predicted GNAT family N-acyltransferase